MNENPITPREADAYLGESEGFTLDLIHAGELQYEDRRRPGSSKPRYKVYVRDLDKWRASRRMQFQRGGAASHAAKTPTLAPLIPRGDQYAQYKAARRVRRGV